MKRAFPHRIVLAAAVVLAACGDDPSPVAAVDAATTPAPPVRVGGTVPQPRKVKHVPPVYSAEARQQRAQGMVILEVLVDTSGRVGHDVRVLLSDHPLLETACIDAVRQWEYAPTLVNGQLVPVIFNRHLQLHPSIRTRGGAYRAESARSLDERPCPDYI